MARDVHSDAVALLKKADERLRCTAYMGEDWVREYAAQDALTSALKQRDAAELLLNHLFQEVEFAQKHDHDASHIDMKLMNEVREFIHARWVKRS